MSISDGSVALAAEVATSWRLVPQTIWVELTVGKVAYSSAFSVHSSRERVACEMSAKRPRAVNAKRTGEEMVLSMIAIG